MPTPKIKTWVYHLCVFTHTHAATFTQPRCIFKMFLKTGVFFDQEVWTNRMSGKASRFYTRYSAPTISHMHTLATHRNNWSNTFQVLVPEMSKVHSCGLASNGSQIDILKLFCFPHTTVVTGASLCKLSRTVPKLLHLDSVPHIVPSVQAPFHFYPPRSGGRPHPEQEPLL